MRRLALTLALLPLPALAQPYDPPTGVAFVQAPEQYSGAVFAQSAADAFELAMAECTGVGALEQDCQIMAWCQPMGYAFDLFVQHAEGPHWHEFQCGLPDEATARAVAATLCDRTLRPYLIECAVVQLWDWDGRPLIAEEPATPTKG